jgi:DNA-binding NtrC family response regulator
LAALRAIEDEDPFDVVVTDVVMPGMDGVALAAHIERRAPGLPVVLMSGYADDPIIATRHTVLAKPFPIADLLSAIEAHLARR